MKKQILRALLVEHEIDDVARIKTLLHEVREKAIEVIHVGSLAEAERSLASVTPDVILASVTLPDAQGVRIVTVLDAAAPSTPIIALTQLRDNGISLDVMRAGAQDFLVKEELDSRLLSRSLRYAIERKNVQEQLRLSEEHFRSLIDLSLDVIMVISVDGNVRYASPSIKHVLGYDVATIVGKRLFDLVHPDDEFLFRRPLEQLVRVPFYIAHSFARLARPDGSWRILETNARYLFEGKERGNIVLNLRDVTKRHQAEDALRESEARYRMLFQANPHPMWVYDRETLAFLDVNEAAVAKYGYTRDEFLSMTIKDIRPQEDIPRLLESVGARREDREEAGIWRHRTKDGGLIDVEIISHALTYEERSAVLVLANDVTERQRAEKQLQESEGRYRRLFEEDLAANFSSTPDGRLLACNSAFLRLFGFDSLEEALNTNTSTLFMNIETRDELLDELRRSRKIEGKEQIMRRRDGSPVHVVENVVGQFDSEGKLIEMTGYLMDDTKRKHLEEQMIQMQKMESLGTLAGGIAHDFNNILGIILGHSLMLESQANDPKKLAQSIDTINKSVMRGTDLVRQILTFARKSEALFQPVQIYDLIEELVKMLKGTFPKNIEFSLQMGEGLPTILGDRTQLHQTLLNLCVNARDAMPNGGTLTIRAGQVHAAALRTKLPNTLAGTYVHIAIADTGTGMDHATRQRIFEPFFTTKDKGKGTGLGLSVVYGIMKSHNGTIDVETEPGKGTTFHLYLPVPEFTSSGPTPAVHKETENLGGSETILVVEDELLLQELVSSLLQKAGYRLLTASDGEQAVEIFERHQDEIALVVTDLGLPKMSGLEVVKKLKAMKPNLKVIFASGYLDPSDRPEILTIGVQEFIEKPYVPNELLSKLRATLDAAP